MRDKAAGWSGTESLSPNSVENRLRLNSKRRQVFAEAAKGEGQVLVWARFSGCAERSDGRIQVIGLIEAIRGIRIDRLDVRL